MKPNKKSQIWVETIIYTLIGLSIMGIVLALATPKIKEIKDKIIIEQTIEALNSLDNTINHVMYSGEFNIRINEIMIKRGKLTIDGITDSIAFEIDNSYFVYSEPEKQTKSGNIDILTTKGPKNYKIILTLKYSDINITYNSQDISKSFSKASTAYKLSIENMGFGAGKTAINIKEVS